MVTAHAEQHSRRAGPGAAAPSRSATFRRCLRVWAAGWLSLLGSLPGQTAEVQERVADLEFVLTTIARGHPDPVGSYGEAVWASHEASLRFRLAHLDDAQFAVELQKLVALLGDADSQLRPLEGAAERLPVEFGWFPDGCFIVGARRGFTDRLGGELVAVEGRPVAAVLQALAPLLSADNPHAARGLAVGQLSRPALLYDAGLADRGDRLRLRVSGPKADGADWTAQAMPPDEAGGAAWTRLSRPSPGAGSGGRAGAWGRVQPDLAYLDLGRATPDPREFGEVLRTWAEDAEVERLVVDLRGVLAGPVRTPEGFAADEWVERLRNSRWNRSASLFVLTSMRMHPGAMAVAVGLDDQTQALFVGGPTGSRPTGRVDVEDRRLPHSPYLLRCATDTAGGGRGADPRRWIEPDLSAPLTFADVQAGRDPALAAIAAFSRGQGAAKQGAASRLRAGHAALPRSRRPSQAPAIGARIEQVPAAPATAVAPEVRAPGRETYLGRTIAQTMHWRGAEWLMRRTREDEEHSTRMLDALGLQPGLTVCDMGCGNGYHTLRMAERVGPDGWVYAADIQAPMLAMLKRRQERKDIDNVVLVHNSLEDPGLPERSCDLILMVDVYHEFSHPVLMLAGMRRALKPGGKLVLVEFRAEDPEVPIKRLHKMSKAQINKEMVANGFSLCGQFDDLPWQHVMTFTPTRKD